MIALCRLFQARPPLYWKERLPYSRDGFIGLILVTNTGEHTTITQKINVILDEVSLERVNSTKFLGVIIDENLTWKHHIDAISRLFPGTLEC